MKVLILLLASTATACGQTGSLYLPDESIESPVEIRTAPAPAPPPSSVPQSDPDEKDKKQEKDDKDEKDEKPPPPGR
jgi:predicted small lipoprotein YifL